MRRCVRDLNTVHVGDDDRSRQFSILALSIDPKTLFFTRDGVGVERESSYDLKIRNWCC